MLVGGRTPLVEESWELLLSGNPDSQFRDYFLSGLKHRGYNSHFS